MCTFTFNTADTWKVYATLFTLNNCLHFNFLLKLRQLNTSTYIYLLDKLVFLNQRVKIEYLCFLYQFEFEILLSWQHYYHLCQGAFCAAEKNGLNFCLAMKNQCEMWVVKWTVKLITLASLSKVLFGPLILPLVSLSSLDHAVGSSFSQKLLQNLK